MMIEVITFKIPDDMTHEKLLENYKETTAKWRGVEELIRKNYIYNEKERLGGGVYHWKNLESADYWHGEEWKEFVRELYGNDPVVQRFTVPIVADNELCKTIEF